MINLDLLNLLILADLSCCNFIKLIDSGCELEIFVMYSTCKSFSILMGVLRLFFCNLFSATSLVMLHSLFSHICLTNSFTLMGMIIFMSFFRVWWSLGPVRIASLDTLYLEFFREFLGSEPVCVASSDTVCRIWPISSYDLKVASSSDLRARLLFYA